MYTETLSPTFTGMTFSQASEYVFLINCFKNQFCLLVFMNSNFYTNIQALFRQIEIVVAGH